MYYDWAKIFKKKSNKELYKIYLGDTLLGPETKEFAKKELEKRGFNFNDLSKQKKKWKLENLIEQQKNDNSSFFRTHSASEYLLMGIIGLIISVISTIFLFSSSLRETITNLNVNTNILVVAFGLIFSFFGFFMHKYKKKKDKKMEDEITELINKL